MSADAPPAEVPITVEVAPPPPKDKADDGDVDAADEVYERRAVTVESREIMITKALHHQRKTACSKQAEGTADEWEYMPVCGTHVKDLGSLGVGVRLYFEYLKRMGILFVILSILASPAMYYFATGDMLAGDSEFGAYVSKISIANLGHCPPEGCRSRVDIEDRCAVPLDSDYACPDKYKTRDITQWLGLLDGIGILIFFLTVTFMARRMVPKAEEETDAAFATMADYALWVWELPQVLPDGQHKNYEDLLRTHFTQVLANCKEGAVTDEDCVRDVTLIRDYDGAISQFQKKGTAIKEYDDMRAWRKDAENAGNDKRVKKYDKKIEKMVKQLKSMDKKLKHQAKMSDLDRRVCSAFVVFRREEYKDKVLDEYRFAQHEVFRMCLPERLRFQGHKINVIPAPAPSDLYWENLDVNRWLQRGLKCFFFILTIIVLIVCSVLLAWLKSTPVKVDKVTEATWVIAGTGNLAISNLDLCGLRFYSSIDCSADASNSWSWEVNETYGAAVSLTNKLLPTNMRCNSVKFHATSANHTPWIAVEFVEPRTVGCIDVVQLEKSFQKELALYACSNGAVLGATTHPSEVCVAMQTVYPTRANVSNSVRPVVDRSCSMNKAEFLSFEKAEVAWTDAAPEARATDITLTCYCKQQASVDVGFLTPPYDTPEKKLCDEVINGWLKEYGSMVGCIIAVLILNQALLFLYNYFVAWERLPTVTDVTTSTLFKLFISLFANTALLIALINSNFSGSLPNFPLFKIFSIGDGNYTDLTAGWFIAVGSTLVITIFGQVFSSTVPQFVMAYIVTPLLARCSRGSAATQDKMNNLYELPQWDLSLRMAQSLNVFFCIFMYSGGMPILYPIGVIYCIVAYWIDKITLLRGSHRPPEYNAAAMEFTLNHIMPWAGFLHTGVAGWAFGNQVLFPSDWSVLKPFAETIFGCSSSRYESVMTKYDTGELQSVTGEFVRARLTDFARNGSWLILLIFCLCCVCYFFYYLWLILLRPFCLPCYLLFMECCHRVCPSCCRTKKRHAEHMCFDEAVKLFTGRGKMASYRLADNPEYEEAAQAILLTDMQCLGSYKPAVTMSSKIASAGEDAPPQPVVLGGIRPDACGGPDDGPLIMAGDFNHDLNRAGDDPATAAVGQAPPLPATEGDAKAQSQPATEGDGATPKPVAEGNEAPAQPMTQATEGENLNESDDHVDV